jgi:hypothetical protein
LVPHRGCSGQRRRCRGRGRRSKRMRQGTRADQGGRPLHGQLRTSPHCGTALPRGRRWRRRCHRIWRARDRGDICSHSQLRLRGEVRAYGLACDCADNIANQRALAREQNSEPINPRVLPSHGEECQQELLLTRTGRRCVGRGQGRGRGEPAVVALLARHCR